MPYRSIPSWSQRLSNLLQWCLLLPEIDIGRMNQGKNTASFQLAGDLFS